MIHLCRSVTQWPVEHCCWKCILNLKRKKKTDILANFFLNKVFYSLSCQRSDMDRLQAYKKGTLEAEKKIEILT